MTQIRPERADDTDAVATLIADAFTAAFGQSNEATLVDALRHEADPYISLVAIENGAVVGHIMFSPVRVTSGDGDWSAMGLAPMAVTPNLQHSGIGSALIKAGLNACLAIDRDVVFVLGHPRYYPKFGFRPTAPFGIRSEYDVSDETFMVVELRPNALAGRSGLVKYHPAFATVA